MGSSFALRQRRSAAQLHALAQVEREIRAIDPKCRARYLRDFAQAYRSYESVLPLASAYDAISQSDIVLIGDYHALPASQRFLAQIVETLGGPPFRPVLPEGGDVPQPRPIVLGLEAILSRHQALLDEWMAGEIAEDELRERLRFDLDWGYAWKPYRELLLAARSCAAGVYGLDCGPRTDMRRIAARDRHAAGVIAEMRARHPGALLLVLFGESHLAPNHLPLLLRQADPSARLLTILQNVDPLYWKAAGEDCERVDAVRLSSDTLCVFNATPLEKYESYRLCIERWRRISNATPDVAPSFYNLIDALLRFLNIDKYADSNLFQARFLVDLLPEVCFRPSPEQLSRLLRRKGISELEARAILDTVQDRGACHVASINAIVATRFDVDCAAEEAARFVHRACQRTLLRRFRGDPPPPPEDVFYSRVLGEALAYLGSKVLCPGRPPVRESALYPLYAQPQEEIEGRTIYSYREYMEMIDFLVLHKDFEAYHRNYRGTPELMRLGIHFTGDKLEFVTGWLGRMLGTQLYDAYLAGHIAKRFIRSLFLRPLEPVGAARAAYFAAVRKLAKPARRLAA